MALRLFGFTCEPLHVADFACPLVLVRTQGCFATRFRRDDQERADRIWEHRRRARLAPLPSIVPYRCSKDATYTFGIVVPRDDAPHVCLDLLRRGVKPWADPRRAA